MPTELSEALEILRAENYGHMVGSAYLRGEIDAREIGECWQSTAMLTADLPAVWQAFVNGYNRAIREG